jgi:integrase
VEYLLIAGGHRLLGELGVVNPRARASNHAPDGCYTWCPISRRALRLQRRLDNAEQRDRVNKNPVPLVKKQSGRCKRAVVCLPPLTIEFVRALLLRMERYGDAALVCLLAYAGPRPQEALALEWRHLGSGRCYSSEERRCTLPTNTRRGGAENGPGRA